MSGSLVRNGNVLARGKTGTSLFVTLSPNLVCVNTLKFFYWAEGNHGS